MSESPSGAAGLSVGAEARVGQFVYHVAGDRWFWSDTMYRIHGFEPGQVAATTEVLQAHKHPDDAAPVREVADHVLSRGEPFSCYHRIIDARGDVRPVVVAADADVTPDGEIREVRGYMVDLSGLGPGEESVPAPGARQAEGWAVVEQATGVLMFAYGVDPDTAFMILAASSQQQEVEVLDLAARVMRVDGDRTREPPFAERLSAVLDCGPCLLDSFPGADAHDPLCVPDGPATLARFRDELDETGPEDAADAADAADARPATHRPATRLRIRAVTPPRRTLVLAALALCSAVLAAVARVWPRWVESLGIDPGDQSGFIESAIPVVCGLTALFLALAARHTWQAAHPAQNG